MVDKLTLEMFSTRVDETFRLVVDEHTAQDAVLESARPWGPGNGAGTRQPFTLTFRTNSGMPLPQRIYRVEHADLGPLDLFLVPIGSDGASVRYEAVFS